MWDPSHAINALVGFLVTVIMGFIVYWVRHKDKAIVGLAHRLEGIYKSLDEKVDGLKDSIGSVTLSFRLIEKDIEIIKAERKNLEDMQYRITKACQDVQAAHEKIREQEEYILCLRERSHWVTNCIQKVAARIQRHHPESDSIDFGEMPKRTSDD